MDAPKDVDRGTDDFERFIQTGSIKEQVYRDKLNYLKNVKRSLINGTHSDFVAGVRELKAQLEDTHNRNVITKEIEIEKLERECNTEIQAVKQEFEEKKIQLREALVIELEEKRKLIEHEYQNMDLAGDATEIKPVSTRKLRRRPNDPLPRDEKRCRKASPCLKFLLQDGDVDTDLRSLGIESSIPTLRDTVTRSQTPAEVKPPERTILTPGDSGAIIDNGKVFYENKCYLRGQSVYVETSDMGKVAACIQAIGDMEISLKSVGDYKKIIINLWELRDGKAILRKRKH